LLQGIAAQMAVVYERVWLKEQVEADRRLRYEVLAHVDPQAVDLLKECPACGACYDNREQTCVHDANLLTHTLPVARTIEARYRLDRRIGQGGMGAVFEATDLRLRRKVAVKVLSGRLFGNLAALRRFEREAEACARLAHRNIVAIHDFGRIGEEGAYLVMEFLAGSTLRSELKRNARIAPPVAAEWFGQLLTGLQTAHEAGVTHRDLKPENILITPNEAGGDRVVILDFGLAKLGLAEPATGDSLTAPGTIVGTVGYMSPEQLSGQPSDQRSDLFSTGVMIFEAMVGKPPFNGDRFVDLLRAISRGCPAIPGDSIDIARLNGVLRKCLAPEPGERFQTAAELRCELLSVLRSVGPTLP
jgi:serine/threonine protein kinase